MWWMSLQTTRQSLLQQCFTQRLHWWAEQRPGRQKLLSRAISVLWNHSPLTAPELQGIDFQNKLRKVQSYISEFRGSARTAVRLSHFELQPTTYTKKWTPVPHGFFKCLIGITWYADFFKKNLMHFYLWNVVHVFRTNDKSTGRVFHNPIYHTFVPMAHEEKQP